MLDLLVISSILIIVLILVIIIFFLVKHYYRRRDQIRVIPYVIWLSRLSSLIKAMVIHYVFHRDDYFGFFIHLYLLWVLHQNI